MRLEQCTKQHAYTLESFYGMVATHDDPFVRARGERMLSLIARLRALESEHHVWGLTSHTSLCLLAQDDSSSPRYVTIEALGRRSYPIDYRMPPSIAPWPGARVQGEARSEDDAIRMIILAMERSGGWSAAGAEERAAAE